jgi:hypothetical protein
MEPLQWVMKGLEQLATCYGSTGIPGSCLWSTMGIGQEQMEITVTKSGKGVYVMYGDRETKGFPMMNFLSRFMVQLAGKWSASGLHHRTLE